MEPSVASIDKILERFDRRYRGKKLLNLAISFVIVAAAISSIAFILAYDREGVLVFRWLTVDGTLFTAAMTTFYIVANIIELRRNTEFSRNSVYYVRLAAAVAECIIMLVVLISQLPFFTEHMHILRYDMFCMHILIPVLTVGSFVLNDTPLGRIGVKDQLMGTLFVTVYAFVMAGLITSGVVTQEQIPYFFLDFQNTGVVVCVGCFLVIYAMSFLLAKGLAALNRRMYWRWFRDLTQ